MPGFITYTQSEGDDTARPVLAWGEAETALDIQLMTVGPDEVALWFNTSNFSDDFTYTYNIFEDEVTATAIVQVIDAETARRDIKERLRESEWAMLVDAPVSNQQAWGTYRAALRAVPNQPGFPDAIVWPTPPNDQEF